MTLATSQLSGGDSTIFAAMAVWVAVVGVSRVVLGRHYVTDVVAGLFVFPLLTWQLNRAFFFFSPDECATYQSYISFI
jgi:membrane-associated phospholipid phosphatase